MAMTGTTTPHSFHGRVELIYSVSDGRGGLADGGCNILFADTNQAPELSGEKAQLADGTEDVLYTIKAADLLKGYSDANGDMLQVEGLEASIGELKAIGAGQWSLRTPENFYGSVELNYAISDGNGGRISAEQEVLFNEVNDAPIYVGRSNQGVAVSINTGSAAMALAIAR